MRQKHQNTEPNDSLQKSTKLQKKKIPILLKLFCKTDTEEMFPNSLYETSITIKKQIKTLPQRKNYRPVSLMNIETVLDKILAN